MSIPPPCPCSVGRTPPILIRAELWPFTRTGNPNTITFATPPQFKTAAARQYFLLDIRLDMREQRLREAFPYP